MNTQVTNKFYFYTKGVVRIYTKIGRCYFRIYYFPKLAKYSDKDKISDFVFYDDTQMLRENMISELEFKRIVLMSDMGVDYDHVRFLGYSGNSIRK